MTDNIDTIVKLMTYNSAADLPKCLDSLVAQTYKNFHLLIVDDASTDQSFEIAQSYKDKFPHITILKNEKNKGTIPNLHYSLGLMETVAPQAKFFLWASPDDWWEPEFLEKTRHELVTHPEAVACFTNYKKINVQSGKVQMQVLVPVKGSSYAESRKIFRPYKTEAGAATYNSVIHGLIRMSEMRNFLPNTERGLLHVNCCELSILAAMLMRGEIAIVPEVLFYKQQYGRYVDKYPTDMLSIYHKNTLRRGLIALANFPRFMRIRRPDRSVMFVTLMTLNLFYTYGMVSSYVRLRTFIQKKRA